MSKPFENLKIYYSGSMNGAPEPDPEFAWKLVQYMIQNGADVPSEHVAARNIDEKEEIVARRSGKTIEQLKANPPSDSDVYNQDINWVDQATHLVALVNGPSHGVGMEIEHAILKPRLGLNETPILCLVQEDIRPRLSRMISGISSQNTPNFQLRTYKNLEQAQQYIFDFLTTRK